MKLPKNRQYTVRLMAPFNMRCATCGEYIYKGKKFNARKEDVENEDYLGIRIYRFYIKVVQLVLIFPSFIINCFCYLFSVPDVYKRYHSKQIPKILTTRLKQAQLEILWL